MKILVDSYRNNLYNKGGCCYDTRNESSMPNDYDYYLLGCRLAGMDADNPPLSRWRFNIFYGEFLRAVGRLKLRASSPRVSQDTPNILRYTRLSAVDELVCRGRKAYGETERAGYNSGEAGPGPQPGAEGPPPPPPIDPAGDREPRHPREPVLTGAGARPMPRGDGQDERYDWRM